MLERRHILLISITVMTGVAGVISVSAMMGQYRSDLEHHRESLQHVLVAQSELIRSDEKLINALSPRASRGEGMGEEAMRKMVDVQLQFAGLGETCEIVVGRRVGERIVFLTPIRDGAPPAPVAWSSADAEPMRRALTGKSGMVTALDYGGVSVLAAYGSLSGLGLGVVAKQDIWEIKSPLQGAMLTGGLAALLVIAMGAFIMSRTITPVFRRLEVSEGRTRLIVETATEGIVTIDERGIVESFNPEAETMFGYAAREVLGENVSMLMGSPYREEHDGYLERYLRTGEAHILSRVREVEGRRKDGTKFALELKTSEMNLGGGRVFTGFVQDISKRKESEVRQKWMMDELDHRVKNNLAAVIALTRQTAKATETQESFLERLEGRLLAMARSHESLAATRWEGVFLDKLVCENVNPFAEGRLEIEGDRILMPARSAGPISMTLHELATNAAKHGSLANPDGRVVIHWFLTETGVIHLTWEERGGPLIRHPDSTGLGISLIRGFIQHELGGEVELDFRPSGLVATLKIPLDREAAYNTETSSFFTHSSMKDLGHE